jgi:threonylcarbamoyladenosine tRNA methylthiotransferase MtaB
LNVYLATLGCRLNEAEVASWSRGFRAAGLAVVNSAADADVVVLNSCAVTSKAAKSSRQQARQLHRNNPDAVVVLTGCYATLNPEQAAGLEGVDLVVGNQDKHRLVERVLEELDGKHLSVGASEVDASLLFAPARRTRAFVKIQDGCRNRCTFCIVTVARGAERSRPIDHIVAEVRALHASGHQEVVLTGVHIGGYGSDLATSLDALLGALLAQTDVPRIRLGSLEPWDIPPQMFRHWASPRLCPHLHLPLQAGSDAVLRRMARRCPADSYRALVAEAAQQIPDLSLTTDVIVGFPGETEADFQQTLQLVEEVGFAHLHIFAFSPRAGTAAAKMPGGLPRSVKRERSARLHTLGARLKTEAMQGAVGTHRPVLWEQPDDEGVSWGYTDTYLRVRSESPRERGQINNARLIEARADHLLGA